jgi:ribA/ribD-fused uncharacterized protein
MINKFSDEHRFLSNFWPSEVCLEGVTYLSVEHAYVASKTLDAKARKKISTMTPGQAKRFGRKLELRADWEDVKLSIMETLLNQKFAIPELKQKLIDTFPHELIEGNTWGDTFWGVCKGEGQNNLGKILMKIRSELFPGITCFC